MTPERQRWWDSLPKEERLVRLAIKKRKAILFFVQKRSCVYG